jgi:DNA-binding CsgD family transcriptional regulator
LFAEGSRPGRLRNEALNENISARAASLLETARVGTSAVALSPREREVLRAVTENLANKEIASQLSISVRTVKFHVSALLSKFGVNTRSQLSDFSSARVFDQSNVTANAKNETDARANNPMHSSNSGRAANSTSKKVSYFPNRSAAAFG